MKACETCGGKFGLVRHYHYRHQFCSERCLNMFRHRLKQAQQAVRVLQFLQWLRPPIAPQRQACPVNLSVQQPSFGRATFFYVFLAFCFIFLCFFLYFCIQILLYSFTALRFLLRQSRIQAVPDIIDKTIANILYTRYPLINRFSTVDGYTDQEGRM